MSNLKKEYTDTKNIKHKVAHSIASGKDNDSKERVIEDIFHALTRTNKLGKRVPA